jgi:hypothetical protein
MITPAAIDALRVACDLTALISEDVNLRKGVGLCPFHDERTPSFRVYPDGHWYCYGCHATGNAIDWIMRIRRMPFVKACQYLAARYGVNLETGRGPGRGPTKLARVLADRTAEECAAWWQEQRCHAMRRGWPADCSEIPMCQWIDRMTPAEMLAIWRSEPAEMIAIWRQEMKDKEDWLREFILMIGYGADYPIKCASRADW